MLSIFSSRMQSSTRRRSVMDNLNGRRRAAQLFNISLETGNLTGDASSFDSAVVDGGDLSVSLSAGLRNDLTVVGAELITNGDMSNWTANVLDDWDNNGESGSDPEISEVGTGEGHGGVGSGLCNIFTTSAPVNITQTITTEVGKNYQLTFDIDTVVSGVLNVLDEANGDYAEFYSTVGPQAIIFTASTTSTQIRFKRNGATDITIDNVSCREVENASFGLQCVINDTNALYGEMTLVPPTSGAMRTRFYIDLSQLEIAVTDVFEVMTVKDSSDVQVFRCLVRNNAGNIKIRVQAVDDSGVGGATVESTTSLTGESYIEILMTQAATNVSADGGMTLFIDGVEQISTAGIDNFDAFNDIAKVQYGATSAIDATTIGRIFVDEIVMRDDSQPIGA